MNVKHDGGNDDGHEHDYQHDRPDMTSTTAIKHNIKMQRQFCCF